MAQRHYTALEKNGELGDDKKKSKKTFVVTSMCRLFFEMYKIGSYCTRRVAQHYGNRQGFL